MYTDGSTFVWYLLLFEVSRIETHRRNYDDTRDKYKTLVPLTLATIITLILTRNSTVENIFLSIGINTTVDTKDSVPLTDKFHRLIVLHPTCDEGLGSVSKIPNPEANYIYTLPLLLQSDSGNSAYYLKNTSHTWGEQVWISTDRERVLHLV